MRKMGTFNQAQFGKWLFGAMGDRKLLWRGDVGTKYEEAWEQWTTRVFKSTQG